MDEELNVTKEVLKRVDVLAEKFGETGAELWRVYVTETAALGQAGMVMGGVCFVLAVVSGALWHWLRDEESGIVAAVICIACLAGMVGLMAAYFEPAFAPSKVALDAILK